MVIINNFSTVKNYILSQIKDTEFCEAYSLICAASTYQELLSAGCGNYAWSYQTIIDDAIMSLFPDYEINAYGIFKTDVSLSNPENYIGCKTWTIDDEESPNSTQELYFVSNSDSVLNISETKKYIVYVMGDALLNLNLSDCSSCDLKVFNSASCTIALSDNSSCRIQSNNNSLLTITASENTKGFVNERGFSSINYFGSGNSNFNFSLFAKSNLSYSTTDSATVKIEKSKNAIVNLS